MPGGKRLIVIMSGDEGIQTQPGRLVQQMNAGHLAAA
jgi:hypothetical protein